MSGFSRQLEELDNIEHKGPNIYAVSDGRAGIERQALAMANAIGDIIPNATIEIKRLNPNPPQTWLPPYLWPMPIAALPQEQREIFKNEMPDIWIANGRRSIAYSLWVKRHFPNIFVVQIQDPKIAAKNFDMVIAPLHDGVSGENVRHTMGGLVYYSKAQVENAQNLFPELQNNKNQQILIILGGNSKTHKFTLPIAKKLIEDLENLQSLGANFLITASRRTPLDICNLFRQFAHNNNYSFFENENIDGANPYLSWLANADAAIITEDSANMMADAAFFKLPIHLVKLDGHSKKFDELHNSFIRIGAACWFNGHIMKWHYEMPKNIEEIATDLIAKWRNSNI